MSLQNYWDRQPCGSKRSVFVPGTLAYFDEIRRNRYHMEYHVPTFLGTRSAQGRRVLELGCGIGTDAVSMALGGARVTAVDFSERSLELAEAQAAAYGVSDRIDFVHWDIQEPLGLGHMGAFDMAYSFGVIHHLERPGDVLKNMYNALKVGGQCKVMVYHKYSTKWLLCKLGLMRPEAQAGVPIVKALSRREGFKMMRDARFRDVAPPTVKHVFWPKVEPYTRGQYVRGWQWWLQPMEHLVGWHLLLEGWRR
jgi:SAM-dependent methyltransferase